MRGNLSDETSRGEPRRPESTPVVKHFCTTFDSRYAAQGLALGLSLQRHDPTAVLWMLCLDQAAENAVRTLGEPNWRAVALSELETADPALLAAKKNRSWIEYIFTLSPCWPRYLLAQHPEIEAITYVDADTAFFSDPGAVLAELSVGDVLVTAHRFPQWLRHLEERGRFNVGVECFRNNTNGRACLDDWRERCLAWCHDRVEPGRYADQKYLDTWPTAFSGVVECAHPGVNLAPWNWVNHEYAFDGDTVLVDGRPLVVYHFARFKWDGGRWADSGQLEYGVMPLVLRSWIYGYYAELLTAARTQLATVAPELVKPVSVARGTRAAWKTRVLEVLFGPHWLRVGRWWVSGRLGLGQYSGRVLVWFRAKTRKDAA